MRNHIDLITESAATLTLYRGDSQHIEQFDVTKTDRDALFGSGIYLTDSPAVARDYSFARTYHHNSHPSPEAYDSQQELVADYLQHIIRVELEWANTRHNMINGFRERAWAISDDKPAIEALKIEMQKAILDSYKEALKRAKAIYNQRVTDMVFVQNTLGQWKLLKRDWKGFVSHFEVPVDYANKCLHGDQPLTDAALKVIRDTIYEQWPDGMVDFRDSEGLGTPFDNWLHLFLTEGVRYSFGGGRVAGGTGENPCLDEIMNGTLAGMHIRKHTEEKLLARMVGLGYVGIEYHGGMRVGGHNRGGGGHAHRAFVFWDDHYINGCRSDTTETSVDASAPDLLKKLTPAKMVKAFREKV